jgi:hypothetical protein
VGCVVWACAVSALATMMVLALKQLVFAHGGRSIDGIDRSYIALYARCVCELPHITANFTFNRFLSSFQGAIPRVFCLPRRASAKAVFSADFNEAQIVELTVRVMLCALFKEFNDALGIEEEAEAVERLAAVTVCF